MFHFPCTSPKDLTSSELPFAVGRHGGGQISLYKRTIEIRSRARRVCADPLLNVRESWGTLLQRMEQRQFGFEVKKPEDWTGTPDDRSGPPNPLHGAGSILAMNTVRRVVGVISLMRPQRPAPDGGEPDEESLKWLDEVEGTENDRRLTSG